MKLKRKLFIAGILSVLTFICSNYLANKSLDLVDVWTVEEIKQERTLIKEEDITQRKMSKKNVSEYAIYDKNEIIGKYVRHQHTILPEQIIREDQIESVENAVDEASLLLNKDERVYALKMDVVGSLGGSLEKGNYVDLAVQKKKDSEYGILVSNVRIVGIKDRNGDNLTADKAPHVVLLAIHIDDVNQILKAEDEGKLVLLARGYKDET